jgi:hypothetical protein
VQVCIAEGELNNPQSKPLIFDIDVIQKINNPLEIESSLSGFTVDLHDELIDIFEGSISSEYRKVMKRKTKLG